MRAMRTDDTDVMLVQAMALGDRQALGGLYDRHAATLMSLGVRMLGTRSEAEDLLHDVLLEAWRRADDYDPERAPVGAWLALRLRSRALDRLRSRTRARVVSSQEQPLADRTDESVEDPALTPDRARVRGVLRGLPPAQRAVLELAYFDGLSSSEIAARLDVAVGTVKSRAAAGLGKLRAAMQVGENQCLG